MSKTRILIVEDRPEEAAYLQQTLAEFEYDVIGISDSPEKAYDLCLEKRPHICVVDIYLNGKPDGVTFVQMLGDSNLSIPIVFLTGSHDNITFYLAKTTNPHSYLLKPYNPLELQYAIELAMDKMKNPPIQESDTLFIKRGTYMTKLDVRDIKYIEVDGKYSKITCAREKFLIQQPLKDLQRQLPATLFSRIHRNYIVNIAEVAKIDTLSNEVLFRDGSSLSFSRRYLDSLLDYFKVLK